MEDYRIKTHWRNSHKRKKLIKALGLKGVLAIMDIWSYCAECRTDGDLSGLSNEDIAINIDYEGDHDELISTLLSLGLLDGESDSIRVHDWTDHNPYVASHLERSEKAKKAIKKRWKK